MTAGLLAIVGFIVLFALLGKRTEKANKDRYK
jgi:hypothetical protein